VADRWVSIAARKKPGSQNLASKNPANVAIAANVAASCRLPPVRPNDSGRSLAWVPALGSPEFPLRKKLQVSAEKHYTKKPD
jgi:hypothetical protein